MGVKRLNELIGKLQEEEELVSNQAAHSDEDEEKKKVLAAIDEIIEELNEIKDVFDDEESSSSNETKEVEIKIKHEKDEECCCCGDEDKDEDENEDLGWEFGGEIENEWIPEDEDKDDFVYVEGYLIPDNMLDDLDEFEGYLRENGELSGEQNISDIWNEWEVFTPFDYDGIPDGFVFVGKRISGEEVLSEALGSGKLVRAGKVLVGSSKIRAKLYRRRYYRKKKAKMKLRQLRAKLRRAARRGRVSVREYRRILAMRRAGTLRRKGQAVIPGRKGFHKMGESVSLFEEFVNRFPHLEDLSSYYHILTSVLNKIEEAVEDYHLLPETSEIKKESARRNVLRKILAFEHIMNNFTTKLGSKILAKIKLGEEMDYSLGELQEAYNEFIRYLEEYINQLRSAVQEGDFDEADTALIDLQLAIDDFFGFLYPEIEDEGEEDIEYDELDEPDDMEGGDEGEDEYILPLASDEDDEYSDEGEEDSDEEGGKESPGAKK